MLLHQARPSRMILLVDDQPILLRLVERVLRAAGYDVDAHGSPDSALDACATGSHDLLLTDFVMPGMSGLELARQVARRRPGIPTLIMSGYPDGLLAADTLEGRPLQLISKPLSPAQLIARVDRALAS